MNKNSSIHNNIFWNSESYHEHYHGGTLSFFFASNCEVAHINANDNEVTVYGPLIGSRWSCSKVRFSRHNFHTDDIGDFLFHQHFHRSRLDSPRANLHIWVSHLALVYEGLNRIYSAAISRAFGELNCEGGWAVRSWAGPHFIRVFLEGEAHTFCARCCCALSLFYRTLWREH